MASKSAQNGLRSESNTYNNDVVRIVMVGKTRVGKSATGNTILGKKSFESKFTFKSMTVDCADDIVEVDGQRVKVIDTPGLFDTKIDEKKTKNDIGKSIYLASPGPHVFLVVIKLGRFTDEEKQTVQKIQEIFGGEADRYSMVLFTHGDLLEDQTIEEFLKDSEDLQELVDRCNGQYHVFNNEVKDRSQVRELLDKIRNITEKNGGSHYTSAMFQEAERELEEAKQRIIKEKEEEKRKQEEEMQKRLDKKYEEEFKKIKEDRERSEREIEARERKMEEERRRMREEEERQREARKLEMEEERKRMREDEQRLRECNKIEMEEERRRMREEEERLKADRKLEMEEERKRMREDDERLKADRKLEMEEERKRMREDEQRLRECNKIEMEEERRRMREDEKLREASRIDKEEQSRIMREKRRTRGPDRKLKKKKMYYFIDSFFWIIPNN